MVGEGTLFPGKSGMVSPRECFTSVSFDLFQMNTCISEIFGFIVPVTMMHKILQIYLCIMNKLTFSPVAVEE